MSSDVPDEVVQDFSQGGYGDCWYLASIKALSVSSLGQQILDQVINIDTDSATVTFQGTLDYTYEISLSGLAAEVNDIDYYPNVHSSGDADVLLLEMALIDYAGVANFSSPLGSGGAPDLALSLLTGKASESFYNGTGDVDATTAKLDELAQIIDHTAITASCDNEANSSLGIPATDHAYSIVGIDPVNKTVSFRNPWYSGTVLDAISYADFAYYFQSIAYVDLTTVNKSLFALDTRDTTLNGGIGDDDLWGGAGADTLDGDAGADLLYACDGDDILNGGTGADSMLGWGGNDTYWVDDDHDSVYEHENEGTDTVISAVSYSLAAHFENLTLTGVSDLSGGGNGLTNKLAGNAGNNYLYGGAGADILTGAAGNDTLDGQAGIDSMYGGAGDDSYYVNEAGEVIWEAVNAGIDTVYSIVSRTLGTNQERLTLTGAAAINGYGNDLNNTLTGNGAANILNGMAGNDTMSGGLGNDTYYVNAAGDMIVETFNAGTDAVISTVSRTLGANQERLTLTGAAAINGNGNDLNNTLTGNGAANILDGMAGNDTMSGGLGNDTYYVNAAGDVIWEALNAGTDAVISTVGRTLGANQENLTLTGAAAINGYGNDLNNTLAGNEAANTLNGSAGSDTLLGKFGSDILVGGFGDDVLSGGSDNDYLFGRDGRDTLTGGSGRDTFVFDCTLNRLTNTDTLIDFSHTDDTVRLDRTVFTRLGILGTLDSRFFRASANGSGDANDYILYNTSAGALLYDQDANGAGIAVQFATLTNRPQNVTFTDFVVVA